MPMPPKRPLPATRRRGRRIYLAAPRVGDEAAFLAAAWKSRRLHGAWVRPPLTSDRFREYVARYGASAQRAPAKATHAGLLVRRIDDDALAGVFNFGDVVRGSLESAYLGYYAFVPHAGDGYMAEGLALALEFAFRRLRLHRVEVNVQPANARSIALVRKAGFVREGYSRRYLKVGGRWRDHVRFALTVEEWRAHATGAR
jgi:ribosomal-protein-alanine N-acetyltransferase